jgi:hypothetical protein
VPPSSDPLGSEAEHWRAIRESRNPSDFMDYLARYGPDGAFSEVAELRLKQLTGPSDVRVPAPPQQRPAVRPSAPRAETPRRPEALPPTQRRMEPPPRRPPPIERDYTRDLRDPPKGQGGPLRAFVLIALLGGAALIGGLYFGGGMGSGPQAADSGLESQAAQSADNGAGDEFSGLDEAPSVPLSEAVTTRADRQTAARVEREPARPAREDPPRTVEREPAPTNFNTTPASSSGGPVPLSPNSVPSSGAPIGPATSEPAPLQTANVEPSILGSATPPSPPPGTVVWAQRPTQRRIADLYPRSALDDGVGGRVVLECRVQGDLSVTCSVASETPSSAGFGRAALSAANSFRARPTLSNGASAVGTTTRIAVSFQAPQ